MQTVERVLETVATYGRRPAPGVNLTPPKLYLNGFPKSGLHLATQMASALLEPVSRDDNWYGTNAWVTERYDLDVAAYAFGAIAPGKYLKGHMGYLPSLRDLLRGLGVGMVFLYRDLRDVVVSQAYHIQRADGENLFHRGQDVYAGLSHEEVMLAVIEGLGEFDGIFERWETFAPWLDEDWVLPVKFEHMVKRREQVVNRFFDYTYSLALEEDAYLDREIMRAARAGMVLQMREKAASVTFRKGKTKQWKREFTARVTECFKAHDPGWLIELGYEQDDGWKSWR